MTNRWAPGARTLHFLRIYVGFSVFLVQNKKTFKGRNVKKVFLDEVLP